MGDLDQAIADYDQVIALDPPWVSDAYCNRGFAYLDSGDMERGIQDLTTAIDLNPQDTLAYWNRAVAYLILARFDAALDDLGKIIEIDPGDAMAHYFRGQIYIEMGEREAAISDLEAALELGLEQDLAYDAEVALAGLGH